jgi:hypothetical protein
MYGGVLPKENKHRSGELFLMRKWCPPKLSPILKIFSGYTWTLMMTVASNSRNIGHGMESIAWRLRYKPKDPNQKGDVPKQDWRRIVLKHPRQAALYDVHFVESDLDGDIDMDGGEEEPFKETENERKLLEVWSVFRVTKGWACSRRLTDNI